MNANNAVRVHIRNIGRGTVLRRRGNSVRVLLDGTGRAEWLLDGPWIVAEEASK